MDEHAYPPQQAGYAPQQAGYPPQQTGYPPQQAGYAPQQAGYPLQQPGYPPQQADTVPQQAGYAPQQAGYPPQQNYAYPGAPPVVVTTAPQTTTIVGGAEPIKDYTAFAIMVTVFCCLPFGIVGIFKASESKTKLSQGDIDGAREASNTARGWSIAGLICGCIAIAIALIVNVAF